MGALAQSPLLARHGRPTPHSGGDHSWLGSMAYVNGSLAVTPCDALHVGAQSPSSPISQRQRKSPATGLDVFIGGVHHPLEKYSPPCG